jgi:hypothetical protein
MLSTAPAFDHITFQTETDQIRPRRSCIVRALLAGVPTRVVAAQRDTSVPMLESARSPTTSPRSRRASGWAIAARRLRGRPDRARRKPRQCPQGADAAASDFAGQARRVADCTRNLYTRQRTHRRSIINSTDTPSQSVQSPSQTRRDPFELSLCAPRSESGERTSP